MSSSDPPLTRDEFVAKEDSAITAAADRISRGLAWQRHNSTLPALRRRRVCIIPEPDWNRDQRHRDP